MRDIRRGCGQAARSALVITLLSAARFIWPVPSRAAPGAAPSAGLKVHTVLVGNEPEGIAVDAAAGRAYIASSRSDMVTVIDTTTRMRLATLPVGHEPLGVGIDPGIGRVYVCDSLNDRISVIDTKALRVTATVPVGLYPSGVAANPVTHRVYVGNSGSGDVTVI